MKNVYHLLLLSFALSVLPMNGSAAENSPQMVKSRSIENESPWKVIVSTAMGFRVSCPSSWYADFRYENWLELRSGPHRAVREFDPMAFFRVTIRSDPMGEKETLESWLDGLLRQIDPVEARGHERISGYDALWIEISHISGVSRHYYLARAREVFEIYYPSNVQELQPTYRRILQSLQIENISRPKDAAK